MPILELYSAPIHPKLDASNAKLKLLSYLIYPGNETQRNEFVATFECQMLAITDAAKETLEHPTEEKAARGLNPLDHEMLTLYGGLYGHTESIDALTQLERESRKSIFDPAGGYSAAAAAKGWRAIEADISRGFLPILTVGWITRILHDCDCFFAAELQEKASLQAVYRLIQQDKALQYFCGAQSIENMQKLWRKYKAIAHLCATLCEMALPEYGMLDEIYENSKTYDTSRLREYTMYRFTYDFSDRDILARALHYQNFLLSFRPPNRKDSLIAEEELHLIPAQWNLTPHQGTKRDFPQSFIDLINQPLSI